MNIFALETATDSASVAIIRDNILLHEELLNNSKRHSQMVAPMIKHVLDWADIKVHDVDIWAVDIGPGSFTGIRIGCATIKALAHVTDKPISGIVSLDVLAESIGFSPYPIYPLIDAQQQKVYTARYICDANGIQRETDYKILSIDELTTSLMDESNIIFTGPASVTYRDDIYYNLAHKAIFAPFYMNVPKASTLGWLAQKFVKAGSLKDYVNLLPFYMRKSQAEIKAGM